MLGSVYAKICLQRTGQRNLSVHDNSLFDFPSIFELLLILTDIQILPNYNKTVLIRVDVDIMIFNLVFY